MLPPDNVTLPPPSMTSFLVLLRTLSVCESVIVSGSGPQLKVITPPAVTAVTTAAEVQLAGVPVPITRSGALTSSTPHPVGTVAVPFGLPGVKPGAVVGVVVVKPASVEDAAFPAASVDLTWKRYAVEAVRPVSVWRCDVVSDVSVVVVEP